MSAPTKLPAVQGLFYPADPGHLASFVDAALAAAPAHALTPKALIVPHAGYVYSGGVAAAGWSLLARLRGTIRRVVLLGPAHRMAFDGVALLPVARWQTPLGELATDTQAFQAAQSLPDVHVLREPFAREHSLEVQLPFIQRALGDVAILPVLLGRTSVAAVARLIGRLWGGAETAIVVSSDLSHYLDHATATELDTATSIKIERADATGIGPREACGHLGVAALLAHARQRSLRVTAVDVCTSGDTYGQPERVVGYGTYAFEEPQAAQLGATERADLLNLARHSIALGLAGQTPTLDAAGNQAFVPSLRA